MKPDILAFCILATTILGSGTRHVAGFLASSQSTPHGGGAKVGDHQGVASGPHRLQLPIFGVAVGGGPARQEPPSLDVQEAQERAVYDPGDGES